METLSIRIDKQTKSRLKAMATASGTTVYALLREAMETMLVAASVEEELSLYHRTRYILARAGKGPSDLSTNSKYFSSFGS